MSQVLTLSQSPETAIGEAFAVVNYAISELRRGGFVTILPTTEYKGVLIMQAAEAVTPQSLCALRRLSDRSLAIALTLRRAVVLGLLKDVSSSSFAPTDVVLVSTQSDLKIETVLALIQPGVEQMVSYKENLSLAFLSSGSVISTTVRLAKLARLLPAAVVALRAKSKKEKKKSVENFGAELIAAVNHSVRITVTADDIDTYDQHVVRTLRPVSEARVPLAGAENVRLIAFRPGDGGVEHLAIIVGTPCSNAPVLVRLHSECFTGDLLGSLRCDCGSQLRGAIAAMSSAGAGVLLYLAQEGRGIGLVNKLRAYQLQDCGFDTLDANSQLGFEDDERIYLPAAEMLRQLGFSRVRLMTNNPRKVEALAIHGIEIVERIPHIFPVNTYNMSYIRTKASKGGHML